ncbi:hypothetical protein TspCOW1_22180 [Thiohalobacter sp. COW1]|uniref:Dithiol-disulfide isomeras n=1 Tax=Thiohalobacter thiocyanaticus TaxID=585455 RepID=A0A1Z4VN48_9GAMM|nr:MULTISPECIES: disulfide bond formation protein DsbA [Thiohalobacter]BAZ92923.1 dithiol-disulfide isomeras [Thiohalobacter thiocyanaticus]BCO32115.1 hypothetical protein TspCOW1_22180 [Thiohalobacter sp. COW1]
MKEPRVKIDYFSDLLCVWAYGAQIKLDELRRAFGDKVLVRHHYIPLFGDTASRIGEGWRDRGGFEGFGRHVRETAGTWDHVEINPEIWQRNVPASSVPAHVFVKAAQLLESDGELDTAVPGDSVRSGAEELAWRLRERFFRDAGNIADRAVQDDTAASLGLPMEKLSERIDSGRAHAAAHLDLQAKELHQVPGSPCLVLNEGRQRLYGNVGYRVIEANVMQLLSDPLYGQASWC